MTKQDLIFAIDLGGTSAKCAFATMDGNIIHQFTLPSGYGDEVLVNLKKGYNAELLKTGYKNEQVKVIGFGAKGPFDEERGLTINAGDIGLFNYPTRKIATEIFGKEVILTNDSRAALIGEWKRGSGQKYHSFIALTLGCGIGGGVVLENCLWKGVHNLAGEIGHGGLMQNTAKCGCTLDGCVEAVSSAVGIENALNAYATAHHDSSLGQHLAKLQKPLTIKNCANLITNYDHATHEILRQSFIPLAARLATAQFFLDVQAFLIGGGPSALGEPLLAPLKTLLKSALWKSTYDNLDIKTCILGPDAGIIGVIENIFLVHPDYKQEVSHA